MKLFVPTASHSKRTTGFTLVEIMVVIFVILVLLGLVTPPLIGVLDANRLTQSGQSLLFRIASAKQIALTENRAVELRFYRYADENAAQGFHASQLFYYDEEADRIEAIDAPLYCATGVMISDGAISPLLAPQGDDATEAPPAEREPFKSMGAVYRKVVFYPNGSTSINVPLREAYLTLCSTRSEVAEATTPPGNYVTIQIDPVNGSTKSYRPD